MDRKYKYNGLDDLLSHNARAKDFFNSLPEWVQETIQERPDRMEAEDDLYRYAENLVQGDK